MALNTANLDRYGFAAKGVAFDLLNPALVFQMQPKDQALLFFQFENRGAEKSNNGLFGGTIPSGKDLDVKIQDSADNLTFADVSGTTATVKPLGTAKFAVTVRKFWRLVAFGNTEGIMSVALDDNVTLDILRDGRN